MVAYLAGWNSTVRERLLMVQIFPQSNDTLSGENAKYGPLMLGEL